MTNSTRRRILDAIQDCVRFIEKEERRSADLRPADVAKLLEFHKQHKGKLIAALEAEFDATMGA